MRVLLLYNPISGSGRSKGLVTELSRQLEGLAGNSDGLALEIEVLPTQPSAPIEWLDGALDGIELLVVVGGDGAMRLAAESALRRGTTLYHYPAGTENLFARDHGMKADPECLFAAIQHGHHRQLDVAWVGGALCLLCASIGLDAEVSHDLASHRRGPISHVSYLRPLLRQLLRWRRHPPSLGAASAERRW